MEGASVVDGSGCNCSLPFAFFPPPSLVVEEEADCAKKKGNRGSGIHSGFFWVQLKRGVGPLNCIDWGWVGREGLFNSLLTPFKVPRFRKEWAISCRLCRS